jgi:hypothetical protein
MSPLSQRFLHYLDRRRDATEAPRRRRARLVLAAGALLIVAALLLGADGHWLFAAPLLPTGIVVAARALVRLTLLAQESRRIAHTRGVIARGVPVMAYVVDAHDDLSRPQKAVRPALALICFEPEVAGDDGYMRYLARRHAERIDELEGPVTDRRQRLPDTETDGYPVYCVDLLVEPGYLSAGRLTPDPLPCLAEPGEAGGIELIPFWLLLPAAPGSSAQPGQEQRV